MITANYLSDIVSGLVDDISFCLEAEEVLFEILSDSELLINEDDIESIKLVDDRLIYRGISYRYVDNSNLSITDKPKIIERKINDFNSCFYWSKTLSGLNKKYADKKDHDYLVSSVIEGLDMSSLLKKLVKFSRSIKKKGYDSRYDEFYQLGSEYKSQELVVAPNGFDVELAPY